MVKHNETEKAENMALTRFEAHPALVGIFEAIYENRCKRERERPAYPFVEPSKIERIYDAHAAGRHKQYERMDDLFESGEWTDDHPEFLKWVDYMGRTSFTSQMFWKLFRTRLNPNATVFVPSLASLALARLNPDEVVYCKENLVL